MKTKYFNYEKYYPPVRNPPDVRLLLEIDPSKAPLSVSLSTAIPGWELAVASIVTEVVLRCRHKYGVSTGEGVSRPWKNHNVYVFLQFEQYIKKNYFMIMCAFTCFDGPQHVCSWHCKSVLGQSRTQSSVGVWFSSLFSVTCKIHKIH